MKFFHQKNYSAFKWLFYFLPSLLLIYSCGKKNSSSDVDWGHLPFMPDRLIELPPQSTITACGYKADLIAQSVRVWAKSIGRDPYLTVNANCESGVRKIRGISPSEEDPSNQCHGNIAAYTNGQYVKFCHEYSSDIMINIALHEVGHDWGLCDQYNDGMNCDANHRGPTDPRSVMGAAQGNTALTPDDIEGIKNLSERTDISANAVWKRFLSRPSPSSSPTATADPTSGNTSSPKPTVAPTVAPTANPTSTPTPSGSSYSQWCTEVGGTWTSFNLNDGYMRCDCGRMLFRQDAMEYYGKSEFQKQCRYYL